MSVIEYVGDNLKVLDVGEILSLSFNILKLSLKYKFCHQNRCIS